METNCLLELSMEEGSEIMCEAHLKPSSSSAESGETDVSSILLDNPGEGHGNAHYSTPGIDFEFVNTELGTGSSYAMDHSSVFDIAEPVIDEKSELFRDAGVFDDCIVKHTDIEKLQGLNIDIQTKKKLIMDLGLKLQIIPLNNLKLVSTIQTSEGIHFVALPDNSSIRLNPNVDQLLIQNILPHLNPGTVLSTENDLLSSTNLTEESLKKADTLKVVELETSINSSETDNVILSANQTNSRNIPTPSVFQLLSNSTELVSNAVKPTSRSLLKESKIVIDLRKLQPQKKARRMVSLLNNPKTNKLFAKKQIEASTKTNTLSPMKPLSGRTIPQLQKSITWAKASSLKHLTKFNRRNSMKDNKFGRPASKSISAKVNFVPKEKTENKLRRTKNGIQSIGSYLCKQCKAKFVRLGNYKNHLQLHKTYEKLGQEFNADTPDKLSIDNKLIEMKIVDIKNADEKPTDNETEYTNIKSSKESDAGMKHNSVEDHEGVNVLERNNTDEANETKTCPETKELKCHICQLVFSTEGNLTRHKLTHMKTNGRYKCTECECGKSFHQQCDLTRHQATHSEKLPHLCVQCGKGFLRKSDLYGHEKFHGKEKSHKCSLCTKSYFQSGDLQRHIRQIHEDTCQFPCLYCSKKYTAQRSLFTHVRSKHMNQTLS